MKPQLNRRWSLARLASLCAGTLAMGLLLPVYAAASQGGSGAEERAARAEERVAHQAEERARRASEREARRAARAEDEPSAAGGENGANQPLGEPAGQQSGTTEHGCRISIQASSTRITAGETVTVSGILDCPSSESAADRQLDVDQGQHGAGAPSSSAAATVTTEADGSYALTPPALYANTVFHVRLGRHVASTAVKVAPRVTLTVSSSPEAQLSASPAAQLSAPAGESHPHTRSATTFTGAVTPGDPGALVALQIATAASERFRAIAFGRVAPDGTYSIGHVLGAPGRVRIRAIVHARGSAPGVSEALSYEVPQPQNPQLTIQASADPLTYGQSVTISGVAAGSASQPVTLLARTDGSAFALVAKGTTDASGNYTFTQAPLRSTYFMVTDASARSTTLFEGVGFALATAPAPSTVQVGQPLTFSGTLASAPAGRAVYLERGYAPGIGFHAIAVGAVDSTSEYAIAQTFDSAGTVVLRIRVPGDSRYQASAGAPFTITVTG
jgi:hypothetical protein